MPFADLREFMRLLEGEGCLVRVREPVSPVLEVTEIHRRLLAEGGPAVLFENVVGADGRTFGMPMLINLFGTVDRVARGMGRTPGSLREVGEMLAFLRQPEPPAGWRDALDMLPMVRSAFNMKPRLARSAACQEIVLTGSDIDLGLLPVQTCWPGDAGPLITWPVVVTRGPDAAAGEAAADDTNLGVYRLQVTGRDTTLVRWLAHRGGARHLARWAAAGHADMPMAVAIGADPGCLLAAVTPVPDTLSEYQFAGLLRGRAMDLVDCRTVPLKVPATAEIVLEGRVSTSATADEGPFGDHTGFYNPAARYPVFRLSAITMRRRPIYLSTFTGRPPDEPSILAEALNELFVPLLIQQFPEIVDFWLPPEACSYRAAVVAIKKQYPGHARRIMMGIWSVLRQFTYTKFVVVVDDDIDPRNWTDVLWAISTQVDPGRDVMVVENTPVDELDFASPEPGLGSKMGIDATAKVPPETRRSWGRRLAMSDEVVALVTGKWSRFGFPGGGGPAGQGNG